MHNSNVLALYGGTPVYAGSWPAEHRVDAKDEEILLCTLRSTNWTAGGMTSAFERGFANFCGARHCLLVENGTAALAEDSVAGHQLFGGFAETSHRDTDHVGSGDLVLE